MFFSGCIVFMKDRRDLARFSGRENHFMRRLLIILVLLLPLLGLMGAAGTSQVTISLTTSVPELLVHGFLSDITSTSILSTRSITDAFNEDGAEIIYAIRTNVPIPLKVTTTIRPFELEAGSVEIGIAQVLINGNPATIDPITGSFQIVSQPPASGGTTLRTPYVFTVKADQTQVQNAPPGNYSSTVEIGIAPET
ncbi:hypothetical protein SDC9_64792 [bioreactor metagenome]|uniref:Uncharacterized protein n=1 Tax=bioreactor metagenome TaxID=1076179 RepID=A0A644XVP9_9ZZZZ